MARGQNPLGEIFISLEEFCCVQISRISQRLYLVGIKKNKKKKWSCKGWQYLLGNFTIKMQLSLKCLGVSRKLYPAAMYLGKFMCTDILFQLIKKYSYVTAGYKLKLPLYKGKTKLLDNCV